MQIKPTQKEIDLQKDIQKESYETRLPIVHLHKRQRDFHENLQVETTDEIGPPIELNANWDTDRKLKELRNGFYVETQRIEVDFLISQLEEQEIKLEKGDVIDLGPNSGAQDDRYVILRTFRKGRIRMAEDRLFRTAIIDLEQSWTS